MGRFLPDSTVPISHAKLQSRKVLLHWSKRQETYALHRRSIIQNAPEASGIYGLSTPDLWIYIGESWNIRAALLEYLSGGKRSVLQWEPTSFTFEPCSAKERRKRQRELVLRYQPVCNRKMNQ